jgi:hypothetical protein
MDFSFTITTPAGTPADAKLKTVIPICRGKLTEGFLFFPSGPRGTLHISISRGAHQIVPMNADEDYALENVFVPLHMNFNMLIPPYQLEAYTWSPLANYDHICVFGLAVIPPETLDIYQARLYYESLPDMEF